jgi:hypothetical protein
VRGGSGGQSGGVARRGGASARPGSGGAEAGATHRRAQSGAGVAHMASQSSGSAQQRNRGGGREVDEGGLDCNFQKGQGPYYNAQVTFKPELK